MKRRTMVPGLVLSLTLTVAAACTQTKPTAHTDPAEAERVSIGYGAVEKDNLTGSVAVLTADELQRRRVTNVEDLFKGRLAGVRVVQTAEGPRLRIRGIHSLHGSNDPLIVLDGTPLSPDPSGLRFLNPQDIERVEVLKGASAAIYGSRGANGVVLITTRR